MSDVITVARPGGYAAVSINRPHARNSLNLEVVDELFAALQSLAADQTVRAVLLRGSGDSAFCAGADLRELSAASAELRTKFFSGLGRLVNLIAEYPLPTVAQVRGFALAGGCGLAAACDFVVAESRAQFGLPELNIGMAPLVVIQPILRRIGLTATRELALRAHRITAEEALRIGLVSAVAPENDLDRETTELLEQLSALPPRALQATRETLRNAVTDNGSDFIERCALRSAGVSSAPEAVEGIKAFFEKRKPKWFES